jgi:hypothetical protein
MAARMKNVKPAMNFKKNKFLVLIILFIVNSLCFSQVIVSVSGISGQAIIGENETPASVRQRAINTAKIEALRKAGIAENISSYSIMLSSASNHDYTQSFSSDIQSEIQGAVKTYKITKEEKILTPDTKQFEYNVIIDAEIIRYDTKPDITFNATVNGIKSVYNNLDKLIFSVKSTQDCYLTVFDISDHDATLLFPNAIEKTQLFEKGKEYNFPIAIQRIDYELETSLKKETNRLIFVFAKYDLTYINIKGSGQATDEDAVLSWIYSIPPDQRKIIYEHFEIVK